MSDCIETVVLILKDVMFRHTQAKFLGEILMEKYGFIKEEDKIKETAKIKKPLKQEEASSNTDQKDTRRYSATQIFSGLFSESKIQIFILGELAQNEDTIDIDETQSYKVYNSKHQLIKIASKSGYAITQFIEQLSVDLGLEMKTKEWFFHRSDDV